MLNDIQKHPLVFSKVYKYAFRVPFCISKFIRVQFPKMNTEARLRHLAFCKRRITNLLENLPSNDDAKKTDGYDEQMEGPVAAFSLMEGHCLNERESAMVMVLLKKAGFFDTHSAPYLIEKFPHFFDWQLVSSTIGLTFDTTVDLMKSHELLFDWTIITFRLLFEHNLQALSNLVPFASNLNKLLLTTLTAKCNVHLGSDGYIERLLNTVKNNTERTMDENTKTWIKLGTKLLNKNSPRDLYIAIDYPMLTSEKGKYYMNVYGEPMKVFFGSWKEKEPKYLLLPTEFQSEMDMVEVVTKGYEKFAIKFWAFPQLLRFVFENSYFTPKIYRKKRAPTDGPSSASTIGNMLVPPVNGKREVIVGEGENPEANMQLTNPTFDDYNIGLRDRDYDDGNDDGEEVPTCMVEVVDYSDADEDDE